MRSKNIHAEMFKEHIEGVWQQGVIEQPRGTYIDYRNKKKKYSVDTVYFSGENMWESAVEWGKKNIDNFTLDMINYL
tara:strand:- start:892 stop:1122 length:231 start_codon:yes stop_codon:yes gene_type:complete